MSTPEDTRESLLLNYDTGLGERRKCPVCGAPNQGLFCDACGKATDPAALAALVGGAYDPPADQARLRELSAELRALKDAPTAPPPSPVPSVLVEEGERVRCAQCGKESSGLGDWAECFTVCDTCWDAHVQPHASHLLRHLRERSTSPDGPPQGETGAYGRVADDLERLAADSARVAATGRLSDGGPWKTVPASADEVAVASRTAADYRAAAALLRSARGLPDGERERMRELIQHAQAALYNTRCCYLGHVLHCSGCESSIAAATEHLAAALAPSLATRTQPEGDSGG